ncbi:MAG: abortive infection family protein [Roseomonas sp.]|nr:abortive infection family protein [Roseomonas sp.]MCA3291275.1 abortive infection family protein [Roseomonas sp.]MCA3295851.1 abortive infection family protein [Roseomonas sp.]
MVGNATISPSIMMSIIDRIEKALWEKFETRKYQNVRRYISRWHQEFYDGRGNYDGANFNIISRKNSDEIDLTATLDSMNDDLLFQIAVDLGIEIPGLIYSVAEIKGLLAEKYEDAGATFAKAHERLFSDPSTAIIMANSALERIVKSICTDRSIASCNPKDTSYKLAVHLLKQFNFFPDKNLNSNLRGLGSGLLSAVQAIENIRSNHTEAHGIEGKVISEPNYAMLIVNSVATIGLFLLNHYEKHYKPPVPEPDDEIPF